MTDNSLFAPKPDLAAKLAQTRTPACVMLINANDPSGAAGLTADIATTASVGGHPVAVVAGTYIRDTAQIFDYYALDDEAVMEQARAALEDLPVQIIKIGFVGTPENLSALAELMSDYPELPVVSYMPNLSWWEEERIDLYLDAFRELVLPQTTVLVGNHSSLWRWLLPDWSSERAPGARDIAKAAGELGVPYTLVTGIARPDQFIDNVLSSPQAVLGTESFERFEAVFTGAGDTLSAALAALLASGTGLEEAFTEALSYLDRCLDGGFRPGMGHVLPDRLFWAQPDNDENADTEATPTLLTPYTAPHDTQH